MKWSINLYKIPVVLFFVLIAGCAKISSPSGGPRDRKAPVVVKSIPENGQKNFSGKRIAITFDEYVVLDKISEKFMVSPPMEKKPVVTIRGKSIIIEYEEELRDSTTYTFYFQDAVKDLNEGNIIDNFQFVFSTGPVIDSLSVTGNVFNAYNLNPPEDALILLYRNLADSAVIKTIPDYIAKADKKGYFRINNVKKGSYRLYALKDVDNSRSFNLADEEIAFMDHPVEINTEKNFIPPVKDTVKTVPAVSAKKVADTTVITGEYKLIMFQPLKKMRYLTSSSRSLPYKLVYTLSLPPDTMDFSFSIPGTGERSFFTERSRERDTLLVWLTDTSLYSQQQISTQVTYPFTDTTGNIIQREDTIRMRFLVPRSTRARTRPEPYKITTSLSAGALKPGQQIIFKSPTPFRPPDTSRIRIYELTDSEKVKVSFSFVPDSLNSCILKMDIRLLAGKSYIYTADSSAFGNIYGERSDSTGSRITVRDSKSFGSLVFDVKNYEGDRILQLLTSDEKILSERIMQEDGKVEFKLLNQGRYRLRVIYDLNGDGKWTTGDFNAGRSPEPVSYYYQEMEVKEGWNYDQEWDISQQNVKKLKVTTPGRL